MKQASTQVLSDAGATVFGSWCPAAAAKLKNVELLTKDTIERAANKSVAACAAAGKPKKGLAGLLGLPSPGGGGESQRVVAQLLLSSDPVRRRVTEALTEARRCGCPPSLCLFCKAAETVPLPPPLVAPAAAVADDAAAVDPLDAAAADPDTALLLKSLGYLS